MNYTTQPSYRGYITVKELLNVRMYILATLNIVIQRFIRLVHTMKIMHIESELIRITCVHTECALTAICIECAFSQSTSIGGLKPASTE